MRASPLPPDDGALSPLPSRRKRRLKRLLEKGAQRPRSLGFRSGSVLPRTVTSLIAVLSVTRYARVDCRVAPGILGQSVQHELDASGDTQFLENLEQVILDGVLTELQLFGNLTVSEAVRNQRDNFFFALRQEVASTSIKDMKRTRYYQLPKNVFHLA